MSRKRVLVVEDDAEVRTLIATVLADAGFEVATAADGRSGFESGSKLEHDVIVADINMPGWSGIEMLDSLDVLGSSAPVVVLTGMAMGKIAADITRSPRVVGVFSKPFNVEEFVGVVNRAVEHHAG